MSDDPYAELYAKFKLPEAHGHIAGLYAVLESTLRALNLAGVLSQQQLRDVFADATKHIERDYPPSAEQTIFPPFHPDKTKANAMVAINLLRRDLLGTPSDAQGES